jgi:hypothetical protein
MRLIDDDQFKRKRIEFEQPVSPTKRLIRGDCAGSFNQHPSTCDMPDAWLTRRTGLRLGVGTLDRLRRRVEEPVCESELQFGVQWR